MRRLKIILLCTIFFAIFYYSCVYHSMTHMDSADMEWATNRKIGEMMFFKSQFGDYDTVDVWDIEVRNSLNPFHFNIDTGCKSYMASCDIYYNFHREQKLCSFFIQKHRQNEPVYISCGIPPNGIIDVPQKLTTITIGKITYKDVMVLNDMDLDSKTPIDNSNFIKNYVWSKKFGLIQYTYQDGTIYTRIKDADCSSPY